MKILLASAIVLALFTACDGETPPSADGGMQSVRLGVPDSTHGPSADGDIDGDGIANDMDNCPSIANADQRAVCAYPAAPTPTDMLIADGLAHLNYIRTNLGLNTVTESDSLSEGCRLHVNYLIQHSAELGSPQLAHEEDLSKPYASEEGNRAGIDSALSLGEGDIVAGIDGWMDTLYHRLPLIHPGLREVGIHYEGGYACIQYRRGTDEGASAPHPIMWPTPDTLRTSRAFGGAESPCPTVDNPLAGGECPPSAAIASLGLHGLGAISDVTMTLTRIDTGEEVPTFRVYFEGGPSPHEQQGHLGQSIALVPEPNTELVRAPYEVRVDATVGGEAQTYRWRFHTQGGLNEDIECDFFGPQGDFDNAVRVGPADIEGKICDQPDFFYVRDGGSYDISLTSDPGRDLDLILHNVDREEIDRAEGPEMRHRIEGAPGMLYIEVRGADGAMGPYVLSIESAE